MPTSAHWEVANPPEISVTAQRVDVGIDPYNGIWICVRIRIGLLFFAAACCDLSVSFADSSPERGALGAAHVQLSASRSTIHACVSRSALQAALAGLVEGSLTASRPVRFR